MDGDDFDPAPDWILPLLRDDEPDGSDRPLTARQRRRAAHRLWQRRDRQSRAGKPLPVFDPLRPTFADGAPY